MNKRMGWPENMHDKQAKYALISFVMTLVSRSSALTSAILHGTLATFY